jgi:hypothetical protein
MEKTQNTRKKMRYDYRCETHGVLEISHGMMESRNDRVCPECENVLKPMITGGASILLTGRPPWAYNDVVKGLRSAEDAPGEMAAGKKTTLTDKRDGSRFKGQKYKIDNRMGDYKAQW